MARLFVGIPVPGDLRECLAGVLRDLARRAGKELRITRPENLHLTLQFLGETPAERVGAVIAALSGVVFSSFVLRFGGGDCLPDCHRARVLYLGADEGGPACASLAERVRDVTAPLGFARGNRFLSHLTLGRIRRPGGPDWAGIAAACPGDLPAFAVDRFVLWQSELTPAGAIHTALAEYPAA